MRDMNKVLLMGRLGADPIQRSTQNGAPVVNFSLATSRKTREPGNEDGAPGEETQWHRVVAWGKTAEFCGKYLKKGERVFVGGKLLSHSYTGKDGNLHVAFEVHADEVSSLGKARKQTEADAPVALNTGEVTSEVLAIH